MKKGVLRITEHGLMFWCSGCEMFHVVNLDREYSQVTWDFNGDYDKPTFNPSILVKYPWGENKDIKVCHSFVRDGRIQYLSDCTHGLAGTTVDMKVDEH